MNKHIEKGMFYKPNRDSKNSEFPSSNENKLREEFIQSIKKKSLHKDTKVDTKFGEIDIEKLSKIFVVEPLPPQDKGKVRYAVSPEVNKRFLITCKMLKELKPFSKTFGLTGPEFERNFIKPLERVINARLVSKRSSMLVSAESKDEKEKAKGKISSFEMPRKATENLKKLYDKLKSEGKDVSNVCYENGNISFIDSAKLVRLYFYTHELKDSEHKNHFRVDDYAKEIFGKDKFELFYANNGGQFITQGQLQALASLLVGEIVK